MKNAVAYLIEPFLTQFFLLDSICRGLLDEKTRRNSFRELARVFCVPLNEETKEYYLTVESDAFRSIDDLVTYERFCRTMEFAQLCNQNIDMTAVDRVILAQKREAMRIKSEIFRQSKNLTADSIADMLLKAAASGNVDAMGILAYMEYHGICICRDIANAVRHIALCAKWNHLFGNLMGLAYDEANLQQYCNTLYTILRSTRQCEVFSHIRMTCAPDASYEKCESAEIIEKAFTLGIIRKETYDRHFAKAAFFGLISTEDKEKLLLDKAQNGAVSLPELPFDVDRSTNFSFDAAKASAIPLQRSEEMNKLLCSLSPVTNNRPALYKTLLVAGNDEYVAEMYLQSMRAGFAESKVFEADAGTFTVQDLIAAKDNFLLRGLSETKESHTVFLIRHCESLGERELEEFAKLLNYENRCKFRLSDPAVCVDLSDVLIVLFASQVNDPVRSLAEACDAVWTENLSEAEKEVMIDFTFRERSGSFGINSAQLDTEGRKYLAPFRSEQIIRIIDAALKRAAFDNDPLVTANALKAVSAQQNFTASRREFGYTGGMYYE